MVTDAIKPSKSPSPKKSVKDRVGIVSGVRDRIGMFLTISVSTHFLTTLLLSVICTNRLVFPHTKFPMS